MEVPEGYTHSWVVDEFNECQRLDRYISQQLPEYSRTFLQKSLKEGDFELVRSGAKINARMSENVIEGDFVHYKMPVTADESTLLPEDIELDIIYEDDDILVVNKPAGMVVHPGAGNYTGTLVNALLGRDLDTFSSMDDGSSRPGIVHRLDKETSGVIIVAKSAKNLDKLSRSFARRDVEKYYVALCRGTIRVGRDTITSHIGRSRSNRQKMENTKDSNRGKEAISHYKVLADNNGASLVKLKIDTGRTHQIRVHMSGINHPIVGDKLYGVRRLDEKESPDRHILHAWRTRIIHPGTQEIMTFTAPLHDDFKSVCDNFGIEFEA